LFPNSFHSNFGIIIGGASHFLFFIFWGFKSFGGVGRGVVSFLFIFSWFGLVFYLWGSLSFDQVLGFLLLLYLNWGGLVV